MALAHNEAYTVISSLLANADFSTTGYARFGTINSSAEIALTSAGGRVDGVIMDSPLADSPVSFAIDGVVTIEAGGTFAAGDPLVSAANGRAVVSTDNNCYAVALESATVGARVSVLLKPKNSLSAGMETIVNTPGAISVASEFTLIEPTGTDAMTLASGLYSGQKKWIRQGTGASTPNAVVTGAFEENGTTGNTMTFGTAGDTLLVVWDGAVWQVFYNSGVTLSTV